MFTSATIYFTHQPLSTTNGMYNFYLVSILELVLVVLGSRQDVLVYLHGQAFTG